MKISLAVKAKNHFLAQFLAENNMNQSELAEQIGITPSVIGDILNFKWIPTSRRAPLTTKKIEKFFNMPIEDIIPPELTQEAAAELSKSYLIEKEVDITYLPSLNSLQIPYEEDFKDPLLHGTIVKVLDSLTPREAQVLKGRFGIDTDEKTLDELGKEMNIHRERVRQIEAKALRKLKHPSRLRILAVSQKYSSSIRDYEPRKADICFHCIYLTEPVRIDKRWNKDEYGQCNMQRDHRWYFDTCGYFLKPHKDIDLLPVLYYRRQDKTDMYFWKIYERRQITICDRDRRVRGIPEVIKLIKEPVATIDRWHKDKKLAMDSLHEALQGMLDKLSTE